MGHDHAHFTGKPPLEHIAEKMAEGKMHSLEIHGSEPAGYLSAALDAAKETAVLLLLLSSTTLFSPLTLKQTSLLLLIFSAGWALWKFGRSANLGWSRLERLHRVVAQEKWEIENNRDQEKLELKELYAAKGFTGKLLDQVVDVLMADGDRLLKVMVEEELGLKIDSHDHPLKQGLGAFLGVFITCIITFTLFLIFPQGGMLYGSLLAMAGASIFSAFLEGNKIVSALIWNLGLLLLSYFLVFYLNEFFAKRGS